MRYFLPALLAAAGLLAGCQSTLSGAETPEPSCTIPAAVRYPVCNVASCPEHPILLVLADGQELRPFGSDWEAFQASTGGTLPERVLISYRPEATPAVHTWHNVTLTCISGGAE